MVHYHHAAGQCHDPNANRCIQIFENLLRRNGGWGHEHARVRFEAGASLARLRPRAHEITVPMAEEMPNKRIARLWGIANCPLLVGPGYPQAGR